MLKLYDHMDEIMENERKRNLHDSYSHWLSELAKEFDYDDEKELQQAILRSFDLCCSMNIPIEENFRKVYRFSNKGVQEDWQVSDFACYLLTINGRPSNPQVARAQLWGIVSRLKKKSQ